jgi:hypothetical protein
VPAEQADGHPSDNVEQFVERREGLFDKHGKEHDLERVCQSGDGERGCAADWREIQA